jgi:hypothetical protein
MIRRHYRIGIAFVIWLFVVVGITFALDPLYRITSGLLPHVVVTGAAGAVIGLTFSLAMRIASRGSPN